jgi:hypothetical protein
MSTEITKPVYDIVNKDSMLSLSNELAKLIKERGLTTSIKGKQYVNVEGWQFSGSALGLMPIITEVADLTRRGEQPGQVEFKYLAKCEVRKITTGEVVSTGIAICSSFEKTKSAFDEYAILSMAQTRAIGKAYRNLLAWLMKAAGFEATPAEEMDFAVQEVKIKVPSEPENHSIKEVFAEIVEEEQDPIFKEELMLEIANCTKVKQLTDIYFTHKHWFDSDETLKKLLSMKKENLTKK